MVVLAPNSVTYVESGASGRKIAYPVNGWAARVTDEPGTLIKGATTTPRFEEILSLEGSLVIFPESIFAGLVLAPSGYVYKLSFAVEGNSVSRITLERDSPLGYGVIPSVVEQVNGQPSGLFVGSSAGPSTILRVGYESVAVKKVRFEDEEDVSRPTLNGGPHAQEAEMDLDDGEIQSLDNIIARVSHPINRPLR